MEWKNPETTGRWPRLRAAAAGFRRLQEVSSWPPLPAELAFAAAVLLHKWRKTASAIAVLTAFHCYLRVGEVVGLTRALTVLPGDEALASRVKPSITVLKAKTGKLQSVFLECPLVIALLRKQREVSIGRIRMFESMTAESLREDLKLALQRLAVPGATTERYVFHSLRHGGAAHDYHSGAKTFAQVKERGRWKSEDCCRLYVQRAKVWLILDGLPSKMRAPVLELVASHHGRRFDLPSVEARFARL
jgi:integrase